MDERGIMIADRDADFRSQVAEHFRKAGYRVETTDSAVHVLCNILEKQTPVLLLGNDFDQKISSADLIHLLKKCNRHLHVILVSDEMPLAQARQVRQEGIFYHALKPADATDNEELGLAVECAFNKERVRSAATPEPAVQEGGLLSWLAPLAVLVCGTSLVALATAASMEQGSSMAIWLFLAFCALLLVTQLLPVFRITLPAPMRKLGAVRKQEAKGEKK
ncbi:response regulator [Citrifermentans bemidjiense Bem]|uniref:Response regulator n=1 Tax=Citrifermentans bemidjiense (strain ATCC BAA-1014 / DSM 16622 / JCM 12645 / Bem) TaxID=404380 RepID=B5EDB6_CITBB|nr:response regulator [Citrifermentans bemidjiense]ACH37702.1 response regulator [Citrifermentans bemidjiense Bem]